MAIIHKLEADGGFMVGDTVTRATCYAYPTSAHARAAVRKPDAVAREMIKDAIHFHPIYLNFLAKESNGERLAWALANEADRWARLEAETVTSPEAA